MASPNSPTAQRLLDAAELLFARSSIAGVTTREIVEAAGQRNVSSISYHFGSREGLLLAILARRGGPVDVERGAMRERLGPAPTLKELIGCLVVPQAELLRTAPGRSYIRIVAQLRGRYAFWRLESDSSTTRNLVAILDEIETMPGIPPALRRERILSLIMLLTSSTAERARRIDEAAGDAPGSEDGAAEGGAPPTGHLADSWLSHEEYVENLTAMCAALLTA